MKISQKITAGIVVVCMSALATISAGAVSEVRCNGGGGERDRTHSYGILWMDSHDYTQYYHVADRVYGDIIYGVSGHVSDCGEEDFYSYCEPGTVVGWG